MRGLRTGLVLLGVALACSALAYGFRHDLGLTDTWRKEMERTSQTLPKAASPILSKEARARLRSLGYGD